MLIGWGWLIGKLFLVGLVGVLKDGCLFFMDNCGEEFILIRLDCSVDVFEIGVIWFMECLFLGLVWFWIFDICEFICEGSCIFVVEFEGGLGFVIVFVDIYFDVFFEEIVFRFGLLLMMVCVRLIFEFDCDGVDGILDRELFECIGWIDGFLDGSVVEWVWVVGVMLGEGLCVGVNVLLVRCFVNLWLIDGCCGDVMGGLNLNLDFELWRRENWFSEGKWEDILFVFGLWVVFVLSVVKGLLLVIFCVVVGVVVVVVEIVGCFCFMGIMLGMLGFILVGGEYIVFIVGFDFCLLFIFVGFWGFFDDVEDCLL